MKVMAIIYWYGDCCKFSIQRAIEVRSGEEKYEICTGAKKSVKALHSALRISLSVMYSLKILF